VFTMLTDKEKLESDELLSRIEKQLDDIDTGEILGDMTKECLEQKGFIGDKPVVIPQKTPRQETEKEHLLFEVNVDFERLPDDTVAEELDAESLLHLKDVMVGQLLATRSADEQMPFSNGINVVRSINDTKEFYHAKVKGKAVIIQNSLHVIISDRDCKLEIRTDDEKMHAYIDCRPSLGNGKPLIAAAVVQELKNIGIRFCIDCETIKKTVDRAELTKKRYANVCVASGKAPLPGDDGKVEYEFITEQQGYDFRIFPDGRIDYHNSKNILMAEKGQLLARLIEPKQGKPGINVFGEEIPAETGAPVVLIPGNGVRRSENGMEFIADANGSIMINGSVLEVVNTFVVNGDVDYSTGNIQFNGNVLINGNVPDGFEVKAEGDIIVAKIVESARLEAGRDVVIKGGVQGKGKGLISAGRDIRIGYAQNARLEAQGNIYIENFAINSCIFTSKCLIMQDKRGSVIGGEVSAQRGLDVRILGSETGVKTFVEAGTNYLVMRKISELDAVIDFCEKNIAKIEDSLKVLYGRLQAGQTLDKGMKQVVFKALEKKKDLEQRRAVMLAKRTDLYEQSREIDSCYVKVKQTCYPDVYIKIKEYKTLVSKPRDNVRFYEDRKAGEIAVGVY
jgi:uncharacterized protein (DUF342 family)